MPHTFAITIAPGSRAGGGQMWSVSAPPALASGPPQLAPGYGYCYQTAYPDTNKDGQLRYECDYEVVGGTGTVTAAYYLTGGGGMPHAAYYAPNYTGFILTGLCYVDQPITVTARFTDSVGASVSDTDVVTCTDVQ